MSVTPRAIVVDERERPARRRWSQLSFGAGAEGAAARGRRPLQPAARLRSQPTAGRLAQSRARRRRTTVAWRWGLPFFSFSSDATKPPLSPTYARGADGWHITSPHDAGRNDSAAHLPRRDDACHRQARRDRCSRGPKGGENLEDYFDALRFGLPRNPALAHRLDRDTPGAWCSGATTRH